MRELCPTGQRRGSEPNRPGSLNPGRLPDELAGRFSIADLATPEREHEPLLVRFERRYSCHLVLYRLGCPAGGGPAHLCSNAHVMQLGTGMEHELKVLEEAVGSVIVAYERPWRFRRPGPE